ARGPARFRSGRIAGCAWLSAAQLSLADHKPANGLYGGSFANRMRYPLEVAAALREVWPRRKALGMRVTGTDWIDGGITPDEAGIFAGKLRDIGFDYVCVSSGGISPAARPAVAPGYQVPLAAAVKKASGITVQAVGMI